MAEKQKGRLWKCHPSKFFLLLKSICMQFEHSHFSECTKLQNQISSNKFCEFFSEAKYITKHYHWQLAESFPISDEFHISWISVEECRLMAYCYTYRQKIIPIFKSLQVFASHVGYEISVTSSALKFNKENIFSICNERISHYELEKGDF